MMEVVRELGTHCEALSKMETMERRGREVE